MESSIAKFLWRQPACERLPTNDFATATSSKNWTQCLGHPTCKHATASRRQSQADNNTTTCKLTWLVLGGDPAARSHRVEQLTAL